MIINRFVRQLRQHDWFAVVSEILVVIVGLMLAFQLDRWWEQRGERAQEAEYVDRLIADVESDIPIIEQAIELASLRKDMADLLMAVSEDPAAATDEPVLFIAAVEQAAFTYSPVLASHTFEDMRSTGNLRLLRDPAIRDELYDYYNFDRSQGQYRPLQLATESRHFELAAGVLSHQQARFVQDIWYVVTPEDVQGFDSLKLEAAEVQATADRLRSNHDFVAWLPQARHLQIEQVAINKLRLKNSRAVLKVLQEYAAGLD